MNEFFSLILTDFWRFLGFVIILSIVCGTLVGIANGIGGKKESNEKKDD